MLWANPIGTNPLRGLIHFVDVSRRDLSFQDLSALRTYPHCGCIPKGRILSGPFPLGLIRFAE